MRSKRAAIAVGLLLVVGVGAASAVASGDDHHHANLPTPPTASPTDGTTDTNAVLTDMADDVTRSQLDIRTVRVVNKAEVLKIRVYFPGVARTYDFPLGAVSVYLDTDAQRSGPEYGHFMDFFSDYRFAVTDGWTESPTADWAHSPEGRCVATAGVKSDKQSKLRWFEYVVVKDEGCFEADAVRVAATTVNTGVLEPYQLFTEPVVDHLGAEHSWSHWIPVA